MPSQAAVRKLSAGGRYERRLVGEKIMDISRELVLDLAALARIEMSADEAYRFCQDLSAILGYFADLNEVDTSDISPTARIAEAGAHLRDDTPGESLTAEDLLLIGGEKFDPNEMCFVCQGIFDSISRS